MPTKSESMIILAQHYIHDELDSYGGFGLVVAKKEPSKHKTVNSYFRPACNMKRPHMSQETTGFDSY